MKYVVVTGGVASGIGKGITISSLGVLLQRIHSLRCTAIKLDPYVNVDASTLSPYEHGETYVTDDGAETDLDLGNYCRFMNISLTRDHNITTGKIYKEVIEKERVGAYLGKTVQIVPHVTDLIQSWIESVAQQPVDGGQEAPQIALVETGGTVGDYESTCFLEALRQFAMRVGRENLIFVHVSLVPTLGAVGEQKTKPTQHSVKELRAIGISPDIVVCRSSARLDEATRHKISIFCQVPPQHVLTVHDVSNIYHVPLILHDQGLHTILGELLHLPQPFPSPSAAFDGMPTAAFNRWRQLAVAADSAVDPVYIAVVGKYTGLSDSYLSLIKALTHSCIELGRKLDLHWVEASELEEETRTAHPEKHASAWAVLRAASGIVVPGGFGTRGVEGKILAVKFARLQRVPILGICLGMQVMVIEYARNVLGWEDANSLEFNEDTPYPVVIFMPEISRTHMGGTLRVGSRLTTVFRTPNDFTPPPEGETAVAAAADTSVLGGRSHSLLSNASFTTIPAAAPASGSGSGTGNGNGNGASNDTLSRQETPISTGADGRVVASRFPRSPLERRSSISLVAPVPTHASAASGAVKPSAGAQSPASQTAAAAAGEVGGDNEEEEQEREEETVAAKQEDEEGEEEATDTEAGAARIAATGAVTGALEEEERRATSIAHKVYAGSEAIWERHRHRYEVNPEVVAALREQGFIISGVDGRRERMEMVELAQTRHPFFFGVQFHPELKSRPMAPSPPFFGFVSAACGTFDTHQAPRFLRTDNGVTTSDSTTPGMTVGAASSSGSSSSSSAAGGAGRRARKASGDASADGASAAKKKRRANAVPTK